MSDINVVILSGRLCADADFSFPDPGGNRPFVSVKLRLATSQVYRSNKPDSPGRVEKTVFHTIATTLANRPDLVAMWKERCTKGARLTLQGTLAMDKVERPGGSTAYYHYVHAQSTDIALPEPPLKRQPPQQTPVPEQLQGRRDALNF